MLLCRVNGSSKRPGSSSAGSTAPEAGQKCGCRGSGGNGWSDASPDFGRRRRSSEHPGDCPILRETGFICEMRCAAEGYVLPIPRIGTWALLGPVGCCCPGPRQGIALGAPGPLPGIANRRALRCPLTRCGQCAWQQANGNLPKGAACLTWENVVRGGDGRGEPLTAWAVTGIRGAHHTPSIHALIP